MSVSATYKCEGCGRTFESGWSNEEAEAEMRELWGDLPAEERALVCDDCFQRGMKVMTN